MQTSHLVEVDVMSSLAATKTIFDVFATLFGCPAVITLEVWIQLNLELGVIAAITSTSPFADVRPTSNHESQ